MGRSGGAEETLYIQTMSFGVPCVTFFGTVIDHGRAGCCKYLLNGFVFVEHVFYILCRSINTLID